MPADVFVPIGEDAQTHLGLPYTRAAELRVVYHFTDKFQWGVAMQNPDQFQGAGVITFPNAFPAATQVQLDSGAAITAPNAFPDLLTKMAFDSDLGGRHMHLEAGGLITSVKTASQTLTLATPITFTGPFIKNTSIGAGGFAAANLELFKGFRVVANGIYGDGIGRYLIGLEPQAVIVPIQTGPTTFITTNSLVHSGGGILGLEATAHKSQFGLYYGGFYGARNIFPDVSSAAAVKPLIGFGAPLATNSTVTNRALQEGSFDWTQTFWRNPQYGAVQLVTQTSYVTRSPWFVVATPVPAPKNAHLMMVFVSLKYILP
jgi:hypothetical protein